jgi:opacity protein-like surface antigen
MHRITTILLLTVSLLVAAMAANAATCQVGVKGGVALQKLGGDDVVSDQVENRTGFVGGLYFQADLSKNFGLRLESLYYMKGATADSSDTKATFKLDYIEFPLLLVGHLPVSETARIDVFGGPTFSFNTKADLEAKVGGLSATVDAGDYFKSFDFGLTFGAGVSFDAGPAVIGLDGRYGFSLTTVADTKFEDLTGIQDADVKNKGFAFMALLGIPVGSK